MRNQRNLTTIIRLSQPKKQPLSCTERQERGGNEMCSRKEVEWQRWSVRQSKWYCAGSKSPQPAYYEWIKYERVMKSRSYLYKKALVTVLKCRWVINFPVPASESFYIIRTDRQVTLNKNSKDWRKRNILISGPTNTTANRKVDQWKLW